MSESGERVFDGKRLRLTHFNAGNSRAILTFDFLRPVALPFGGHPASSVLRAAGRAGLLMEMLARDGGPGLHDLRNTYRMIRRGEPTYLISLARHALHRQTRVADWALSRLEEMDTDGGSNPLDAGQESS